MVPCYAMGQARSQDRPAGLALAATHYRKKARKNSRPPPRRPDRLQGEAILASCAAVSRLGNYSVDAGADVAPRSMTPPECGSASLRHPDARIRVATQRPPETVRMVPVT